MKLKIWTIILIITLILFIGLTLIVLSGQAQHFNESIYSTIEVWINPGLTNFMIVISNMGEWFVYVPLVLLALLIPKLRIKAGVPLAVALATSAALNVILKNILAIDRPDMHRLISESGYGFPSGHAMNGTVFIGLCIYLFVQYSHQRSLKILFTSVAVLFLLTVGFSRVYLGVHNLTDVLGGYFIGLVILSATAVALILRTTRERVSDY